MNSIRKLKEPNYNEALVKLILFTFRYMAVTFGGCTTQSNRFAISKNLKRLGYINVIIVLIIFFGNIAFNAYYPEVVFDKDDSVTVVLSVIWCGLNGILVLLTAVTLQKRGSSFINFLKKYHVNKKRLLIAALLLSVLFAECLFLLVTFGFHSKKFVKKWYVRWSFNIGAHLFAYPLFQFGYLLVCITSLIACQNLKRFRQELKMATTAAKLSECRQKFNLLRQDVSKIDKGFSVVILLSFSCMIMSIMMGIFNSVKSITSFTESAVMFITYAGATVSKLIAICIFSGILHDESDEFVSEIDCLDVADSACHKEASYLLWVVNRKSIGFFVAGFAVNKSLVVSIFTFILTYTILLVQNK